MKKVYSNELLPMAGYIQSLLENNGIRCSIKNQALGGALGEIPPIECWPEVWVLNDEDYEKAMALITSLATNPADAEASWSCACGEENSNQFYSCWNCGGDRPPVQV